MSITNKIIYTIRSILKLKSEICMDIKINSSIQRRKFLGYAHFIHSVFGVNFLFYVVHKFNILCIEFMLITKVGGTENI